MKIKLIPALAFASVMGNAAFAQAPGLGRAAKVTFFTGKEITSPRAWFATTGACTPGGESRTLMVESENGVRSQFSPSQLAIVDIEAPVPLEKYSWNGEDEKVAVTVSGQNGRNAKGIQFGMAWVCVVLPLSDFVGVMKEFPPGVDYPAQNIYDLRGTSFESLKNLLPPPASPPSNVRPRFMFASLTVIPGRELLLDAPVVLIKSISFKK